MDRSPEKWREDQYVRMGFDQMRAKILAHSRDDDGIFVYWRTVEASVAKIGLDLTYDLFAFEFEPYVAEALGV